MAVPDLLLELRHLTGEDVQLGLDRVLAAARPDCGRCLALRGSVRLARGVERLAPVLALGSWLARRVERLARPVLAQAVEAMRRRRGRLAAAYT